MKVVLVCVMLIVVELQIVSSFALWYCGTSDRKVDVVISVSVKEIFQRVADARCLRLRSQSEKLSESLTAYLFIFGVALSNIKYQSLCCRNGVTLMVEITEYGCY